MNNKLIRWVDNHNPATDKKFSIIIPTWNNLSFLKTCIESIQRHSHFQHQIIIHVNEGNDGSLEWVQAQGYDFTHSENNAGVCWAINACRSLVKTDYIVYMNDDMYVLPEWDLALWEEVAKVNHPYFFLSSTMIEPTPSPHPGIIAPYDYGRDPFNFEEEKLLDEYQNLPSYDWNGATWPPNIVHKHIWDLVGGYSVEYFPGMYSDPDFSMKLIKAGVTHFKGVAKSKVYHFGSKSTQRVKRNNGSKQFLNKWGITSSTLTKYILQRGAPYSGEIDLEEADKRAQNSKLRSRIKRVISSLSKTGQVDRHFNM